MSADITGESDWSSKRRFQAEEIRRGFSDAQLEQLCAPSLGKFGRPKFGLITGREPYWPAELYSFGRGLRMLARLPQWIPIPANLEHGVDHRTYLDGGQETQRSRYFLAWQGWRARAEDRTDKKIHLTLHPMVALRKTLKLEKLECAKGTLVFIPHSDREWQAANDFSESLKDFLSLPLEFHPIVFCIQMRDIEKGMHRQLRSYDVPIVSAGDINSRWFAERFYSILRHFVFSSSTDVGSHVFLSEEMGVNFFLLGAPELRQRARDLFVSLDPSLGPVSYRLEHWEKVFSEFPPRPSVVKDQLVDYALGTGVPYSVHRRRLQRLFLQELLFNGANMGFEGLARIKNRFRRLFRWASLD